ncbi:MAG: MBL fold metallo-hydrolase [Thermoplasmatales archaeon]|nr:MBL fold metallo-hydrolase [Thermoplasmatales archaeon]
MKLIIVYDNQIYKKGIGLKSDWGFSCLIETKKETVLFDTGAKHKVLFSNMQRLGIDLDNISKIVISHEHWDHNGSLEALALYLNDVDLYRIGEKNPSENMRLVSVLQPCEITQEIFTTGLIKGQVDEQSLVLKSEKGWYVLVGCSHPGVGKILNTAKQYGNITGLIGGLHHFNDFPILENLKFICPCHCTKYKLNIKQIHPTKYVEGGVGKIIEI